MPLAAGGRRRRVDALAFDRCPVRAPPRRFGRPESDPASLQRRIDHQLAGDLAVGQPAIGVVKTVERHDILDRGLDLGGDGKRAFDVVAAGAGAADDAKPFEPALFKRAWRRVSRRRRRSG